MDEAKRNGHVIFDDVLKWLTRADGFIQDASKFLEDEKAAPKSCFNGLLCPNLKSRYQLSRAARKKAGDADKIHGDGFQIEKVSYRPPLLEIRSAPSEALPSRLLALNEVMEALKDSNINRIGVWGLGGVRIFHGSMFSSPYFMAPCFLLHISWLHVFLLHVG